MSEEHAIRVRAMRLALEAGEDLHCEGEEDRAVVLAMLDVIEAARDYVRRTRSDYALPLDEALSHFDFTTPDLADYVTIFGVAGP